MNNDIESYIQNYIKEYNIDKIFSEILNQLVLNKIINPIPFMIKYLCGLLSSEERKKHNINIEGPFPKSNPIIIYPFNNNINDNKNNKYIQKILSKELFNEIKFLKSKNNANFNDILSEENELGVQIPDFDCLNVFNKVYEPIINYYNNIDIKEYEFQYKYENFEKDFFPYYNNNIKNIQKIIFSFSRNLKNFPFINIIDEEQKEDIINIIKNVLDLLINSNQITFLQKFENFNDNENENKKENIYNVNYILKYINKNVSNINNNNFYEIYINKNLSTVILINLDEHLEIFGICDKNIDENFILENKLNEIINIIDSFEKKIKFEYSNKYGFINKNIKKLGYGFNINSEIIISKNENIEKIIKKNNFDNIKIINDNNNENEIKLNLENYFKLNEINLRIFIKNYYNKISGLINYENDNNNNLNDNNLNEIDDLIKEEKNILSNSGKTLINYYNNKKKTFIFDNPDYIYTYPKFTNKFLLNSQHFNNNYFNKENSSLNNNFDKKNIISLKIKIIRNLKNFPFSNNKFNKNKEILSQILNCLNILNLKEKIGQFYSFDKQNEKETALKILNNNNIKLKYININNNEENFGGVIQLTNNIIIVINDIDHLKFYFNILNPNDMLNDYIFNVLKMVNNFNKNLNFINDNYYGIITSNINKIGNGLTIKFLLKIKMLKVTLLNLIDNLNQSFLKKFQKKKFDEIKYYYYEEKNEKFLKIWNNINIGKNENEIIKDMLYFISQIFIADKNL